MLEGHLRLPIGASVYLISDHRVSGVVVVPVEAQAGEAMVLDELGQLERVMELGEDLVVAEGSPAAVGVLLAPGRLCRLWHSG